MSDGLVYIIILTYNGLKWIDGCLTTVLKTNYGSFKVLIVDNASSDGSVEHIRNNFPNIEIIVNAKNYGFAEGNNVEIRHALKSGAHYIVLLNQDTKVDREWVPEMVKIIQRNQDIGILSPMQYDYEGKELDHNFKETIKVAFSQNENVYFVPRIIGCCDGGVS